MGNQKGEVVTGVVVVVMVVMMLFGMSSMHGGHKDHGDHKDPLKDEQKHKPAGMCMREDSPSSTPSAGSRESTMRKTALLMNQN